MAHVFRAMTKNTHSEYVCNVIAFSLQECLHERTSILRHTYIACLIKISLIHFTYFANILQWQYCNIA
jgi:hypothetical protein